MFFKHHIIIYSLLAALFFLVPSHASAHRVSFEQNAETYGPNELAYISLTIDTEGEFINAVELYFTYDADALEIIDIVDTPSIIDLWVSKPHWDPGEGSATVIGGIAGGIVAKDAPLATFVVQLKEAEPTNLSLDEQRSKVFLNDGFGNEEAVDAAGVELSAVKTSGKLLNISSSTHPDETIWYPNRQVRLFWNSDGGKEISFTFSKNFTDLPDDASEGTASEALFENVEDGVWYFAIKRQIRSDAWTSVERRRVLVDATPPDPFVVTHLRASSEFNGNDVLLFDVKDAASGIVAITIEEDGNAFQNVSSPYTIVNKGAKTFVVHAFDRAGNEQIISYVAAPVAEAQDYTLLYVLVALIVLFGSFIVVRILYKEGKA